METKSGSVLKFILIFCGGFILGGLGLIGYQSYIGYYDNTSLKNNEEQIEGNNVTENQEKDELDKEECDEISYSELAGYYSGLSEKDSDGGQYNVSLVLWENGTFKYEISNTLNDGFWGYLGNYKIENKKVVLNAFFGTGGGTGFNLSTKRISLTIDDDMSLTEMFYSSNNKKYTINYRKLNQQEIANSYEADITFNDIIKNNCSEEDNCIYISE